MSRLSIFLLIIIVFHVRAVELFAQNFASVKWGPEIKGYKTGSIYPIGFDETGYYIVSANMFDYFFQKLDTNLSRIVKTKFIKKNKEKKGDYKLGGIVYFNGRILVLKYSTDIKKNIRSLYIDSLSNTTLFPVGCSHLVTQFEYTKVNNKGNFWADTSSDGKLLLIISDLPGLKKENARFNFIVYNTSLEKLWEKQVELSVNEKLFTITEFWVSNNGNVFINGKEYFDKKVEQFKWKQNFQQKIFSLYNQGEIVREYNVDIGEPFFNAVSIKINEREQIICAGLYSRKSRHSVDGFFYCMYDSTLSSPLIKSVKEFKIETLTEAEIERKQNRIKRREEKGKENEMPEYKLKSLELNKDGGCTLIAEQEYVETRIVYYGIGVTSVRYYCNDDILVIKGDSLGNLSWTAKIPKKQESSYYMGHYSSFCSLASDSALYIIYNDHKGNTLNPKRKSNKKDFSLNDSYGSASIVRVNNQGETTKSDLYNLKETEVFLRPKSCRQINNNTMLIFGEKEKKEQYAIVKLLE